MSHGETHMFHLFSCLNQPFSFTFHAEIQCFHHFSMVNPSCFPHHFVHVQNGGSSSPRHVPRPLSGLGIMAPSALAATETLSAWCLGRLGGGLSHCFGIPSGYVKIAIENNHL